MLPTDIRVRECVLFFLPVKTRVPLKFGAQVVDRVTCARAREVTSISKDPLAAEELAVAVRTVVSEEDAFSAS